MGITDMVQQIDQNEWVKLSSLGYFGTFSRACCRILRLDSEVSVSPNGASNSDREHTHKLPCHSYKEI